MPPGRGLRPLHPRFPTFVGFGLARVLVPTRGGVANVGCSPPLRFCGGHPPHPLPWGLRSLDPRLPTLVGLGFAGVLGPTRIGVVRVSYWPLL
jgi:hypothetical protein